MKRYLCLATLALVAQVGLAQDSGLEDLESLLDAPVNAASQYLQTAREAPAAVTVVSAAEIQEFGYRTLGDILQQVPGFYMSDDLETQFVGTRGFGRPGDYNTRVMVLIDGLPQNEAASGYIFLDQRLSLSMDFVERVEVVRGPGSTLYGSGAMLAVINVVTKSGAGSERPTMDLLRGQNGSVEAAGRVEHAFENGFHLSAWGQSGNQPGKDIYFSSMDTPETNHGVAEGQDWRSFSNFLVQGTYGDLRAVVKRMNYEHGSPASLFGRAFNNDTTRTGFQGSSVEVTYTTLLGAATQLHLIGSANGYTRRQVSPIELGNLAFVTSDRGSSNWYRAEAQFRIDTTPANRLFVGTQFKMASLDYRLNVAGQMLNQTELSFNSISAYAQNEYRVSRRLAATAGLRFDHYSSVGGAFAPRLAVVFNASTRSTLKLLYGSAFRAPNVEEIHSESDYLNLVVNPGLEPEYIDTIEGRWEHEWGKGLASSVSLYDYRMRGLIELSVNDQLAAMQYQNVGTASARGVELGISGRADKKRFSASAAFQRAVGSDGETALWSSPSFIGKAGVSTPLGSWLRTGVQVRGESGRKTSRNTETSAFTVVDLTVNSRPLLGRLQFGLRVRNLMNTRYELPGSPSHTQPALEQAGRTFSLQASMAL